MKKINLDNLESRKPRGHQNVARGGRGGPEVEAAGDARNKVAQCKTVSFTIRKIPKHLLLP
jgi:hypothetical protein